jgi:hypothetical protein
MGSLDEFEFL